MRCPHQLFPWMKGGHCAEHCLLGQQEAEGMIEREAAKRSETVSFLDGLRTHLE